MCPCPFCATIAVLALLLVPFKKPREWMKKKLKKHHKGCETCQKAEHLHCKEEHIQCTCEKCKKKKR